MSTPTVNPTDQPDPEGSSTNRLASTAGASGVFVPDRCPGPAGTWPCALEFGHGGDHVPVERSEGSGVEGHARGCHRDLRESTTVPPTRRNAGSVGRMAPSLPSLPQAAGIKSGLPSLVSTEPEER